MKISIQEIRITRRERGKTRVHFTDDGGQGCLHPAQNVTTVHLQRMAIRDEVAGMLARSEFTVWARDIALVANAKAAGRDSRFLATRFSRKAGCSCGCSPGFITELSNLHFDVMVTISYRKEA